MLSRLIEKKRQYCKYTYFEGLKSYSVGWTFLSIGKETEILSYYLKSNLLQVTT